MSQPTNEERKPNESDSNAPKVIQSDKLFAGEREVHIHHAGETYRLRITRRNKLILQK